MNKTELTAFYAPKTLDTTWKTTVSGEYIFTKKRKWIWQNDEKIFIKIMTEIGKNRPRSLKEEKTMSSYALIRVADEFEDGTKPI